MIMMRWDVGDNDNDGGDIDNGDAHEVGWWWC